MTSFLCYSSIFCSLLFCLLPDFQEAFQLFDQKGDGRVQVSQIGDILRALGQNPTESDVKKLTHNHRPEERVNFEVFLPILQAISKNRSADTAEDFIEGLRHFDKDGNGYISSAELRHLLTTLGKSIYLNLIVSVMSNLILIYMFTGEKLADEEVGELLNGHEDSQGNVNYEEFVRAVMSG